MEKETSRAEALLKHLGLTEYESKAYVILLRYGALNAERVSDLAKIPLPRVYDTMSGLAQRGFVFVSKTRPQIFKATDPSQLSRLLQEDEMKKLRERTKAIQTIVPQFLREIAMLPTDSKKEPKIALSYVMRKSNIERLWADLHDEAQHELFVFAGDLSWLAKTTPQIRKALRKGVDYRIIWCKPDKKVIPNIKRCIKLGVGLRYYNTKDLRGVIIDGDRVSFVQSSGARMIDPDAEDYATFTNIIINNRLIAGLIRRYFLSLWRTAMPAERFLEKLKYS
jgi:sugar-specific transcriptional regulator TrmB